MTGISFINSQLGPKRIQLLRLLNPKTVVIAVLVNPKNPNAADAKAFVAAGRSIGVDIVIVNASTEPEIKQALDRAVQQHADALLVHVDALCNDGRGQEQIVSLAGQHRLPSMMATHLHGAGRPHQLWREHQRVEPASRRLCRPYRRVAALMPYTANDPQAQNRNAALLQGLQQ